jgi:hypothetical protein
VPDRTDRAIAALAGRQRGYVTRRQLLDVDLGPGAIDYRLKIGRLIRVHAGVCAVGHLPITGPDRAYGRSSRAVLGPILGYGTAACLWGLDKRWRTPFEVIVKTARRRPGIRTHRATMTRRDARPHNGIRVTSPARTLFDISPRLTDKALRRAVNDLRIARHLRLADLAELLARCPNTRGAALLKPFVEVPRGPTRSELEDAFGDLSARFNLPRAAKEASRLRAILAARRG